MTSSASLLVADAFGGTGLIAAGIIAVLVVFGALIARSLANKKVRGELPTTEVPALDSTSGKPEKLVREQVDGPVEIDKKMSLAEIKAAKAAVLSKEFKSSKEAQAEIMLRKTGGMSGVSVGDERAGSGARPLAVTPVSPAAVTPGVANETPTAPQPPEVDELVAGEVEVALREARTTESPAIAEDTRGADDALAVEPDSEPKKDPNADSPSGADTADADAVGDETAGDSPDDETQGEETTGDSSAGETQGEDSADERSADGSPVGAEADAAKPPAMSDRAPVTSPDDAPTPERPSAASTPVDTPAVHDAAAPSTQPSAPKSVEAEPIVALSDGLAKTRGGFFQRLGNLFTSKSALDEGLFDELEELLFTADIGVKTSQFLLERVQSRHAAGEVADSATAYGVLRQEMSNVLHRNARQLEVAEGAGPQVWLMVGVNGAGKTTTVGKLAAQLTSEGKSVLMVAGDTFRAAAVGQLERWAERVGCGFHRGDDEADPSSVIFDGVQRAIAEGFDVVLCDTAGRLQTKTPLMDELAKIGRVAGKALSGAPHETILVVDANTGQNAIQQARQFGEAVPLTGMILTKLDGTAKGGVVLGISQELDVPIYHIGIGEGVADLRRFDADEFVEALFL